MSEKDSVRIETKKYICNEGFECRKISAIYGVPEKSQLPSEYLASVPCFYWDRCKLEIIIEHKLEDSIYHKRENCSLKIGSYYKEEDFQKLITYIKEARQRLECINKIKEQRIIKAKEVAEELKIKQDKWNGEETITV